MTDERNVCCMCGYFLCVDKHHPEGKVDKILLRDRTLIDADLYKKSDNHLYLKIIPVHKNPENYIYLCPNCHMLVHRKKFSLEELKKLHKIIKSKERNKDIMRLIEDYIGKIYNEKSIPKNEKYSIMRIYNKFFKKFSKNK
tara:strand:+ start:1109 stop:1531 length:423 start_codon:yes stop_codon:yes gene_type:complete